jgi:peptidoglycan/LPS O-acetylase OafA/YrhL
MRENPLARLAKRIARYSYGIYLLHYFAIWIGFVVCRKLNIALQMAIFATVLVSLSVLLYHTVESPLIAAGVKVSQKFRYPSNAVEVKGHSSDRVVQICSEQVGSS